MKNLLSVTVCLAALSASFIFLKYVKADGTNSDEAEIRALQNRWASAVRAKNIDNILKCYVPDLFSFDVVPPRQYVGADAYREDWKESLAYTAGPLDVRISDLVVKTDRTLAFSREIVHVGSQLQNSKKRIEMNLRVTDDYQKIDGAWLMVQEHVSVPVDILNKKADLLSALD